MGVYSIKDLENFTRIKAHTLRIWEQRYNLLNPERTDTNIRLYSERDLKKILNINLLYVNGLKISKIANLSENEIFEKANDILMSDTKDNDPIDRFINLVIMLDEASINAELDKLCEGDEFEKAFSNIIIPVLKKIGELWQVDSITVSHEHFFSNILRKFILSKSEGLEAEPDSSKVILFLNDNEYHELGLLFYNYFLRKRAYHCIYLGQAVPLADLEKLVKTVKPDYLFSSLIAKMDEKQFSAFFEQIAGFFPLDKLYVGGYQLTVFPELIPEGVHVIHSVDSIVID